ncbi:Mitochondrial import inner membrane translocase subunit Tim21, partial [Coemansia erecta]
RRTKSTFSSTRVSQIASTTGNVLLIGSVLTMFGYIAYTLYDNLLAEHGVTRVYNESLDLVRASPEIRAIFGTSIKGFGEPTHGQRQRQRAITHREFTDEHDGGRRRLYVQYYIEDSGAHRGGASGNAKNTRGVVRVDMSESRVLKKWDFNSIVVDVYADGRMQRSVDVLVTDEFRREAKSQESRKRNQVFSTTGRGASDGSWFSVLNPSNWRK